MLYLPGFWVSLLIFPQQELSAFERFIISIAVATACVLFVSVYMHYFGIIISLINVFLVALALIGLSAVVLLVFRAKS
ncbi:MAG: hypothetical protein H6765_09390 [Candidatus Peribacteria bacterium]|nr:MAG: hypothetical protein H6765_09390 [Candidatus Peribacteria bacterium]